MTMASNQSNANGQISTHCGSISDECISMKLSDTGHLDQLRRFETAHGRDQQTNTQTDHATLSAAIGCILMRSGLVQVFIH